MIEDSANFLPIWMLLSAAFGFIIGDAFGDSRRHRKCLEHANRNSAMSSRRSAPANLRYTGSSSSSAASSTTSTSR